MPVKSPSAGLSLVLLRMICGAASASLALESNCNVVSLLPADNVRPVSAVCEIVTSLSTPNPNTAASLANVKFLANVVLPVLATVIAVVGASLSLPSFTPITNWPF